MDPKRTRILIGAAAGVGVALGAFIVVWQVSAAHAEKSAGELVSASADMVRCVGGEKAPFEPKGLDIAFQRRLVSELPDVSTVGDCTGPVDTVKQKLADYQKAWFRADKKAGTDGQPLGAKLQKTVEALAAIPYATPSDKVLRRKDPVQPLLTLPKLTADLYEASAQLYQAEGASGKDLETQRTLSHREPRKVPPATAKAKVIGELAGKLSPDHWGLTPLDNAHFSLYALSDKGRAIVLWSEDAAASWKKVTGPEVLVTKPGATVRVTYGPQKEPWLLVSYPDGQQQKLGASPLKADSPAMPEPGWLALPGGDWSLGPQTDQQLVVVNNGTLVFPMRKVIEKPEAQKKDEAKRQKEWEKHLDDKEVQDQMALETARVEARKAAGIDENHVLVHGLAYATPGHPANETQVRELQGYGLGMLTGGPQPMMLLGKDELPAVEFSLAPVPATIDAPASETAKANSPKAMQPNLQASPWLRCTSPDGSQYGFSVGGTQLIKITPASLSLVPMMAVAEDNSHVGCGEPTAALSLPLTKDRIFTTILTLQGDEIEGGKLPITAGTHIDEFNSTVSVGVVPNTIAAAWVTEGFVQIAVSRNNGTEFFAPQLLAEADADGSKISGVRLIGLGSNLLAVLTREKCEPSGGACSTRIEVLLSDDAAKTWKAPQ